MKKLNNKGMTLTELIVSFVIVSVAVVYFSTTIIRVVKVYRNSEEKTDEYVLINYHFRLIDAYINKNYNELTIDTLNDFLEKTDENVEATSIESKEEILIINVEIEDKNYVFTKKIPGVLENS